MKEVTIIGVDLAKNVFQVHGAAADGSVVFRKKLSRPQFAKFMSETPACIVAMEACATAHYWGREMTRLGHEVRLIAPIYVKPFVKRQKNDTADAEAIVEAALRPTMRFVEIKTAEQQSRAMLFRTRELLVGQRTKMINALRAHLAEHGFVVAKGVGSVQRLATILEGSEHDLPDLVRQMGVIYLDEITRTSDRIDELKLTIKAVGEESGAVRRLQTMPGLGPITAMAIETFAPPMEVFKRGRDFAAWLGLVPRQHSTGGKPRLGHVSKMGQRDIRRLLIIGAMSVIRAAVRKSPPEGSWLERMLARKPRMLVAIALANKMARLVWAMLVRKENYKVPAEIAA